MDLTLPSMLFFKWSGTVELLSVDDDFVCVSVGCLSLISIFLNVNIQYNLYYIFCVLCKVSGLD